MQRTLRPELLDSLPHDHPDALHNRRDLRLTNLLLGSHRWLERIVPDLMLSGESALELGAGTGELCFRLARRGAPVAGLDRCPRPEGWTGPWHRADLRRFSYSGYAVIVGNLIFHQFTERELARLGERLRATVRVIVACEPHRRRLSQTLYRGAGPFLGFNHVSRHDGHVSIAAGFRGNELPRFLGLDAGTWRARCSSTVLGAYRMIAVKRI